MKFYEIEIAVDNPEADQFCEWLNSKGHSASVGDSTGNYIDGELTGNSVEANEVMNNLWDEYCNG